MKGSPGIICVEQDEESAKHFCSSIQQKYLSFSDELTGSQAIHFRARTPKQFLSYSKADVLLVGPSFSDEAAYSLCRDAMLQFEDCPVLLFRSGEMLSLERLRYFSSVSDLVLLESEPASRVIFGIFEALHSIKRDVRPDIISCVGSKGGVGTTSIAVAIAEAAEAAGRSALLVDLSRYGVIPFYLRAARWDSVEYASFLERGQRLDEKILKQVVEQTPSGLSVLLPPKGGPQTRERWLRDAASFERTLSLIEQLSERYQTIVIDHAGAEGVLSSALLRRSSSVCLITSGEASAMHLSAQVLAELSPLTAQSRLRVVLNQLAERNLNLKDLKAFIGSHTEFSGRVLTEDLIAYDAKARYWLGSGTGFYSAAGSQTKLDLRTLSASCFRAGPGRADRGERVVTEKPKELLQPLRKLLSFGRQQPSESSQSDSSPKLLTAPGVIQQEAVKKAEFLHHRRHSGSRSAASAEKREITTRGHLQGSCELKRPRKDRGKK